MSHRREAADAPDSSDGQVALPRLDSGPRTTEGITAEPIVFISRWRIRVGKRAELEAMYGQAAGFIGSSKPRTALFAAYLDEAGDKLRIVHAFPDAAAMTDHFEGSEGRSASVEDMIELLGFEVFGAAPGAAVEQLRRQVAAKPGAELTLLPRSIGGYLRAQLEDAPACTSGRRPPAI